jgi:hypothetical protein
MDTHPGKEKSSCTEEANVQHSSERNAQKDED